MTKSISQQLIDAAQKWVTAQLKTGDDNKEYKAFVALAESVECKACNKASIEIVKQYKLIKELDKLYQYWLPDYWEVDNIVELRKQLGFSDD